MRAWRGFDSDFSVVGAVKNSADFYFFAWGKRSALYNKFGQDYLFSGKRKADYLGQEKAHIAWAFGLIELLSSIE